MTRHLPHVGLGGDHGSLYGDASTRQEWNRQRVHLTAAMERHLAEALGRMEDVSREPIRVQASVGEAIPELTSDA